MSFKELFNERFLSVVNEIDIHAESILIKLDETKNKNEIDEVNILRQKFISKCKEIENYNLETFSDKRKKLKFIMFIKNSSMLIDEKENKLNFVNELGYLVIFDQHLKYETIMQLKKILNENVEVVETQLDSFQELVKLRIFEDLIKKNSSDLFIDLCDPSKNIIDDIDLSSSNFGFNNYELDFLPKFINLDLVEALLFSNNQKKYLSSRPFSYFKNITNLTIEMCDCLQEISPYNFQSLDNLIQLIILNTGTKRINANAFNGLKNLQVLHLSENKIENIDVCAFNGLENLECLYLDQNRITKIQANNFASLIKLEHLFLDSNEIEELKSGCLNGLVDLKVLKISMNSSDCLDDSNVFSPLKSLQVLYLFDVNFSEINPNLFNELTNLKFLNVCRSNLFSIDINLQTLEVIDISETKLTKDEINSIRFDNLKLLT
ncbi:unnamed protein product [Brachionus calyciflorus]|uniref:Uncharacterized protein n=1 Tax=Brachionus calyciflorus TaxID=104777 RepID=A0A813WC30_9BILA|nr:unnamed protein product [Brachionus calyciflorus]